MALEVDSAKQSYVPYEDELFINSERLAEALESETGKLAAGAGSHKLLSRLAKKILDILAGILGVDLYFRNDNPNLPVKWARILAYLKNEGLIERHGFSPQYNDYPKLIGAHIVGARKAFVTDGYPPSEEIYSNAASLSIDTAIAKAIGEFIERFTLLQYDEKNLKRGTFRKICSAGLRALDPAIYADVCPVRNSCRQSEKYDKEKQLLWVKARELFSGDDAYIPAQRVFWTYKRRHDGWNECFLAESNSSGGSAGATLEEAVAGGIYELIERDAFLIFWLNAISPPIIEKNSVRHFSSVRKLLDACERYDLDVYILNTMTDIEVPTCAAVIIDGSGAGPAVSLGAGCSATWETAIESALIEALKIKRGVRSRIEEGRSTGIKLNDATRYGFNMQGRVDLWAKPEMLDNIGFMTAGEPVSFSSISDVGRNFTNTDEELNHLKRRLKLAMPDCSIYCYEALHPVLTKLNFASAMVVIPELVPMYLRELNISAGAKRIKSVPPKLGYSAAAVLNNVPHPFP